jgi:hypothetical protein
MRTPLALLTTLCALLFCGNAPAQEETDGYNARIENILKLAVQNLKGTLQNGSDELKESAIAVVKELKQAYPQAKLTGTVIPLMQILRSHPETNIRLLAAMTLREIGDERGLYAIKEASVYDTHQIVRHVCASMAQR